MPARQTKAGYFTLEALNSLGTTYYFFYIYFFTEKQFGFTKFQNLMVIGLAGLMWLRFRPRYVGR